MKRWINCKMLAPWVAWKGMTLWRAIFKKKRELEDAMAAGAAALAAEMAAMQNTVVLKKLKMH